MESLDRIHTRFNVLMRYVGRRKAFWLRGLLCWVVGLAFFFVTQNLSHDLRFRIRPDREPNKDILVLDWTLDEWVELQGKNRNGLRPIKEVHSVSDSYYWQETLWRNLLEKLLAHGVRKVTVLFHFPDTLRSQYSLPFTDGRILWLSSSDPEKGLVPSLFQRESNWGLFQPQADGDGVLRRYARNGPGFPDLVDLASQPLAQPQGSTSWSFSTDHINFLGGSQRARKIRLADVLLDQLKRDELRGKIIVIGDQSSVTFQTPTGPFSRAEIFAQVLENRLHGHEISRIRFEMGALILLGLLLAGVWIVSQLPQGVGLITLIWTGIAYTALSFWIFDTFSLWIPLAAAWVLMFVTHITFLNFQLTVKEYQNWHLEEQKKNILELEELKNNFVSLISHDLKTPIAKIQAICDGLIPISPSSLHNEGLEKIRKESHHLLRSIQSILQITLLESQNFKIHKEAADINEIIEDVVFELSPLAQAKNIHLQVDFEPLFLTEVDIKMIREVVLNLIENAIKYSPESTTVKVSTSEVDDNIIFMVEDQGPGVSKEEQSRIFDKFYRAQKQTQTQKGSGLGLFLVKYFVELHGGKVLIESYLNVGTRIGFSLPTTDINASQEETFHEATA